MEKEYELRLIRYDQDLQDYHFYYNDFFDDPMQALQEVARLAIDVEEFVFVLAECWYGYERQWSLMID